MNAKMIDSNSRMEYWRFEYPGYDSLYSVKGGRRSRAWGKYIPLKKQYYVVAFDLERELISFVSGNFYLSRFAEAYFPKNRRDMLRYDSLSFAWNRQCYVEERLYSYCPDLYFDMKNRWPVDPMGEDDDYWYYSVQSAIPYNKLFYNYNEKGQLESILCCLPPDYRYCKYKARMSKKNWEIVEIIDTIECMDE